MQASGVTIRAFRAAIVVAVLGALAGCDSSGVVAVPATAAVVARTGWPPTCAQLYAAWQRSVQGPGVAIQTAMATAIAGMNSQDVVRTRQGLVRAAKAATQMLAHPVPECADHNHYWRQILDDVTTADHDAFADSGMEAIIAAGFPLLDMNGLSAQLHAELKRAGIPDTGTQ